MQYVKSQNFSGTEFKEIPCITDKGAPTLETEGAVGMFYMDEGSGTIYKRTATGWKLIRNIAVVDEEPDDLSDYADGDIILVTE